jgi:hypothetical protein
LGDEKFREEALDFALQTMRQVKESLLRIIDQLTKEGFSFIDEGRIITDPEAGVRDWISECRNCGIYFPIVFEAWLLEIGSVNFIGTHPNWLRSAYAFDGKTSPDELIYPDPLVVEFTHEYFDYLYNEWRDLLSSTETQPNPPFRLEISPDHLHKANISGGLPYELDVDRHTVDTILLNERHSTSFLGYIRRALVWKGFPGFDYIKPCDRQGWERSELDII